MTSWRYIEPNLDGTVNEVTVTEDEILSTFFPWWAEQMHKVGKDELISLQHCIDDWVTVHWAERVDDAPTLGSVAR